MKGQNMTTDRAAAVAALQARRAARGLADPLNRLRASMAASDAPPVVAIEPPREYRLGSSPAIYAPGIVVYLKTLYLDPDHQARAAAILCDGWGIPAAAAVALLSLAVPSRIDGETVVFTA